MRCASCWACCFASIALLQRLGKLEGRAAAPVFDDDAAGLDLGLQLGQDLAA